MADQPTPWPMDKRSRIKKKIEKEAARAAGRLGASGVVLIAFFQDGEYLHMQDGGKSPVGLGELYAKLQTAHTIISQSDGDVSLS